MLKLVNLSQNRISIACRALSTSSINRQQGELAKAWERDHGIRSIEKKPARLPLVKNFFLPQVDTELLAYPEAIYETDHQNAMIQQKKMYESFLDANIFANPDDASNIEKLKEYGSFRSGTPFLTETAYSVSEAEARFVSYGNILSSHKLVFSLLNQYGSASQKLKFGSKLETGELIGAAAIFESRSSDIKKPFVTEARFKDDNNTWVLNGEKAFVQISPAQKGSTLYLVIASIDSVDRTGDYKEGMAAFLVDGNLPGVNITSVDQPIGCTEKVFNQVSLSFKDVVLDESSLLSDQGLEVACSLLNISRMNKGIQAMSGVMKPLIKELVNHCIETKIQGINLKDIDTIKEQLGSLTSSYYTLESMVYMTAGLTDIYEKQDVEVETAMVHSFAIQAMTDFIVRPLHAVGPRAVLKDFPFERYIRDSTQLAASGENLDGIRQFIGIMGLHHAGSIISETVKKDRNPLNHPAFIFAKIFKQTNIERPKKKFNLEEYVHPSLFPAANSLELSILRLNAAADILLARYGPLVVQHTVEVAKLADAATLCYAMFATTARASRAYCIGLRNADQEVHIANYVGFDAMNKVKQIAVDIDNGSYGTGEHTFKTLGEILIETKEYNLEHPTARNF